MSKSKKIEAHRLRLANDLRVGVTFSMGKNVKEILEKLDKDIELDGKMRAVIMCGWEINKLLNSIPIYHRKTIEIYSTSLTDQQKERQREKEEAFDKGFAEAMDKIQEWKERAIFK